jgi:hypothetical protein
MADYEAKYGDEDGFIKALRLSADPQKKFRSLEYILGWNYWGYSRMLDDIKRRHSYGYKNEGNPASYVQREIEGDKVFDKYVNDIPVELAEHQAMYTELHLKLQTCIALLKEVNTDNGKIEEVREAFKKITLEGYSRIAFPDLAITYHQIELFILLFKPMKHNECNDDNMREMLAEMVKYNDTHLNIKYAAEYLQLIGASIAKYYPEKAPKYKYFVDAFGKFADFIYDERPTLESEIRRSYFERNTYELQNLKYGFDLEKSKNMFWSFVILPDGKISDGAIPESYPCSNASKERPQFNMS